MAQSFTLKSFIAGLRTKTSGGESARSEVRHDTAITLSEGTDDYEADEAFTYKDRSIEPDADEDIDFAGSLQNAFGETASFSKIKAIKISAPSTNAHNLVVTRPATLGVPLFIAAGDGVSIPPGGEFEFKAPKSGITVTAATGDLLNIANGGSVSPVLYTMTVVGIAA